MTGLNNFKPDTEEETPTLQKFDNTSSEPTSVPEASPVGNGLGSQLPDNTTLASSIGDAVTNQLGGDAGPDLTPPTSEVPSNNPPTATGTAESAGGDPALVSTQLTRILGQDSDLLKRAQTRGLQSAHQRGLLNSSIGVQAGEAAVLDVAVPVAAQDADVFNRRGLLAQDIEGRSRLQAEDATQKQELLQQDIGGRQLLQNLDNESKERIATLNVQSNDRDRAASIAAVQENTYSSMFNAIMNNPNMPAAERQEALTHISELRAANLNLIEQLYNVDLAFPGTGDGLLEAGEGAVGSGDNTNSDGFGADGSGNATVPPPSGTLPNGASVPLPDSPENIQAIADAAADGNADQGTGGTDTPSGDTAAAVADAIASVPDNISSFTNSFGQEVGVDTVASAAAGIGISAAFSAFGISPIGLAANALSIAFTGKSLGQHAAEALGFGGEDAPPGGAAAVGNPAEAGGIGGPANADDTADTGAAGPGGAASVGDPDTAGGIGGPADADDTADGGDDSGDGGDSPGDGGDDAADSGDEDADEDGEGDGDDEGDEGDDGDDDDGDDDF